MKESNSEFPAYVQVGDSAAYALPGDSGYGWAGCVLPEGTAPTSKTLTPSEAFNGQKGHFLFAPAAPEALAKDPKTFVTDFYTFLDSSSDRKFIGQAILWMPEAVLPAPETFNRYGVRLTENFGGSLVVQNNLNIPLGSRLTFYVNQGAFVSYDENSNTIKINTGTVTTKTIGYLDNFGDNSGVGMPGGPRITYIVLTGNHKGSIRFTSTYKPTLALKYFSTGFSYSVNNMGKQQSLFYPVFDASGLSSASINLGTVLDPIDTRNTHMAKSDLVKGFYRTGYAFPEGINLSSWFRTTTNHAITLRPLRGIGANGEPVNYSGGLVYYETPYFQNKVPVFGMTLVGDYALTIPGYEEPPEKTRMLCGLFGMEWLSFIPYNYDLPADKNDHLRFLPCQGAYAPVFPFTTASMKDPASGNVVSRLDQTYRISWANLLPGASQPAYSAQPEGSSLYGDPVEETITLLSSAPPRTILPTEIGFSFPLVPYAGITGIPQGLNLNSFESEIIAATRKSRISNKTGSIRRQARTDNLMKQQTETKSTPRRLTTPQGFLVDLAPDGVTYEQLLLARSQRNDGTILDFTLQNPTTEMLEALQTNQVFLVGVNTTPFTGDGASFSNKIVINDWTFVADVGDGAQPTSYRNVLIMKFCSGSLKERVTNPNRWTMPGDFSLVDGASSMTSLAYTGLSQWLQDYITRAEAKAASEGQNSIYSNFVKLAGNPDWNGIIVLNANLPLEALPAQLAGISAGIDYSRFLAHHFGASVTRVKHENGTLAVKGISSMFGLIDYQNPAYEAAIDAGSPQGTSIRLTTVNDYAFSVLQLQVLFVQSRMVRFNSYIQLSLDSLFGSAITRTMFAGQTSPINAMVLKGTALQQNGKTTYVYEQTGGYLFALDSNVLRMISVNRVQFNTLGPSNNGATMNSRFLMWGRLNFALLKTDDENPVPFDLLSFGSNRTDTIDQLGDQGLAYGNLTISMSFPTFTPNATNFLFTTDHLSFDLGGSTIRDQSIFKGFALQIKKFIAAPENKQPKDYNFLTVEPRGLSLQSLSGNWYGISYKVIMGTPGALVSAAGFESDLLVAWSPSSGAKEKNAAIFAGLSLPGAAPGASIFSLQGVIKVSTGPIKLLYQKVPGSTDEKFFNLQLTNIGIKILGIVKLPPGATIQFFLFGDPGNTGSLGWYAAYVQNTPEKANKMMLANISRSGSLQQTHKAITKKED